MIFKDCQKVGKFLEEPDITMQRLYNYGFKNIEFDYNRILYYLPDLAPNKMTAIAQIERGYLSRIYNALFATQRAVNGNDLKKQLLDLLQKQYEKRIEIYNSGEKLFDFQSSYLITLSAEK